MYKTIIILLTLIFSMNLLADQCQWNEKVVATKALRILKQNNELIEYCELCDGDKAGRQEERVCQ